MSVLVDLEKVNSNLDRFFQDFSKAGALSRVTRFRIFNQIDSSFVVRNNHCKKYTIGKRNDAQKHEQNQTHSVRHVLSPAFRHTCAFSSMWE